MDGDLIMIKADIGLIGLAVMGQNLVLNIERNGYIVSVYNRTVSKVDQFINNNGENKNFFGTKTIIEFVNSIKKPRKIILMIKAGIAVDNLIDLLKPLLNEKDVLIDAGNSFYKDTIRRYNDFKKINIYYLGVGVSGGEEGALKGLSIMIGGSREGWDSVSEILTKISAKVDEDFCCAYLGEGGAGHFVKMVHNGIEYSDMQLIAETYSIMRTILNLTPIEISDIFSNWNEGELGSYLIQITSNILKIKDEETSKPIIDVILDTAEQKGTGKWTSQVALDLGIPIPSISEAVFARYLSSYKNARIHANKIYGENIKSFNESKEKIINKLERALLIAKICSYAQGLDLIQSANEKYDWNIDLSEVAKIWRGGCIIRSVLLNRISEAFKEDKTMKNLLFADFVVNKIKNTHQDIREVIKLAIDNGIPLPAFSSVLSYFDGLKTKILPTNLIQAQRDYFGAHSFERIDKKRGEYSHYEKWPPTY